MKRVYIWIICLLPFFFACSEPEIEEGVFNLGKGTYGEPFVGILKSRPALLVKSLEYPPFSWLKPDTVYLEKTFAIDFNEECIRSKSSAWIQITDTLGNPLTNMSINYNGQLVENGRFFVLADEFQKEITIGLKILPIVGNEKVNGYWTVQGTELDVVNDTDLQQENNSVANWTCKHEIGCPILLWLSWLLVLIILLAIIVWIVWQLIKLFTYVAPMFIGFINSIFSFTHGLINGGNVQLPLKGNIITMPPGVKYKELDYKKRNEKSK
jgi:hypothetical protein